MKRFIAVCLAILAIVLVAAPLEAGPSAQLRGDNFVLVRGTAVTDAEPVEEPIRSVGFLLLQDEFPLDKPVQVVCGDGDGKRCHGVNRGDSVLVKGKLRTTSAGMAVVVSESTDEK